MSKGNPRYRSGRALEYLIKNRLEKEGYFVIRAAGSHGVADLVAIRYTYYPTFQKWFHIIKFVSCKISEYAPPAERQALIDAAKKFGAEPMMTKRGKGNQWVLEPLTP